MNHNKLFIAIILISAAMALAGCTGSQTTSNNPAASTAVAVGFARNSPAPIGTAVTHDFEISEHDSNTGKYSYIKAQERVTVLDVKRGYGDVETVLSADGASKLDKCRFDVEHAGFEPLLIKMKYELLSIDRDPSQAWQATDYNVGLVATDGSTYVGSVGGQPFHIFTGDYGVKELWYESYGTGSTEGYVLMFVDDADYYPLVKYNAGSNTGLWFKTTP